jgi:hypothetical protein
MTDFELFNGGIVFLQFILGFAIGWLIVALIRPIDYE